MQSTKKDLSKLIEGERDPDRVKILQNLRKTYNSVPVSEISYFRWLLIGLLESAQETTINWLSTLRLANLLTLLDQSSAFIIQSVINRQCFLKMIKIETFDALHTVMMENSLLQEREQQNNLKLQFGKLGKTDLIKSMQCWRDINSQLRLYYSLQIKNT